MCLTLRNNLIVVRYGEIALKGKETRRFFENKLVSNIKKAFEEEKILHSVKKEWGRIFVYTNETIPALNVLKKIFGITSFSPAVKTESSIEAISKTALRLSIGKINEKTSFALRVTRTGSHSFTSQDVAILVGEDIVKKTHAPVDLNNPDFELFLEIRDHLTYVFTEKIPGPGGLPVGTQGNIAVFVDSDRSLLAGWYLIKRGCNPVLFIGSDRCYIKKIRDFFEKWYIEPDICIMDVNEKNFYENLNKKLFEKKADAFSTGHTLYEKSERNLLKIKKLKRNINLPVLHPLIATSSEKIKEKLWELGIR